MNKIGRIKLMSKNLTAKECEELSQYYRNEVGKRWKKERLNEIINLGVGGRVVYYTSNRNFDVTGKTGTIKEIKKRRGRDEMVASVEFDEPVWTRTSRQITNEFWDWWKQKSEIPAEKERILAEARAMKTRNTWNNLMKIYERETGIPAKKEFVSTGNTLINIGLACLRPATEENISNAQCTRRHIPLMNALNKAISKVL